MKDYIVCKREFTTLTEDKRPTYLTKVGKKVTINAAKFVGIVPAGTVITAKGVTLLTLLGAREDSVADQDAYDLELAADKAMMEKVYDFVDLTSAGDADIIALAGITGTSSNTTSVGVPNTPVGLVYVFAKGVGEMFLARDVDKLAKGSLTVTFTDPKITVVKSGSTQLMITCADGNFIYLDVETIINLLIENQEEGTKIMSVMSLFNSNGLSPVASPTPVTVPR
jgi:hypothetical protein